MNSEVWKKVLSLISRTGDRMIVVDPETEEPFVVMDFSSYSEIVEEMGAIEQRFEWDEKIVPPPTYAVPEYPPINFVPKAGNAPVVQVHAQDSRPIPEKVGTMESIKRLTEERAGGILVPHVSEEKSGKEDPQFFTEPAP